MSADRIYKLESIALERYWVPDPVISNPISGVNDNTTIPPTGEGGWGSVPLFGSPPNSIGGDSDGQTDSLPSLAEALQILLASGGEISGILIDPYTY